MSNEDCYCCKIIKRKEKPRGRLVLDIGDGWVLSHFSANSRNYLGRLALMLKEHKKDFTELSACESKMLGIKIQQIHSALKNYWTKEAKFNDELERIYVVYFGEGEEHLHIHLFPRTKDMLWGCEKAIAVAAWELVHTLDMGLIPEKYKIIEISNNEIKEINEEKIKRLMEYLKGVLKGKCL